MIGSLIAPFKFFEQQICLFARLLAEPLERMREVNRLRFRPACPRNPLLYSRKMSATMLRTCNCSA